MASLAGGAKAVRQATPAAPWPVACRPAHACCAQQHPSAEQHTAGRRLAAAAWCAAGSRQRAATPAATAAQEAAAGDSSEGLQGSSSGSAATASALAGLRYTSPDGRWVVRPLDKANADEVRRIVALQTDAFHTASPLPALDGMSKRFFQAEVLSEMLKKLEFNPDDMFVSLLVEPADPGSMSGASSNGSDDSGAMRDVVGVVEVSYIAQKDTLALLGPGFEGYCYVASMAVAPAWRRRGAAQALLAAAEEAAAAWDERQTLLHVYQDNEPAVQLYRRQGYEVLHQQSKAWGALGRRPRYTMIKRW